MRATTAILLVLASSLTPGASGLSVGTAQPQQRTRKVWDVRFRRDGVEHELRVPEEVPVLAAAEWAGLMPSSDCRRGNCLSCVAAVIEGAPFSLKVSDHTSLCQEVRDANLVPLCSAYVTGPGVTLELDEAGRAWDLQHREQFQPTTPAPPTPEPSEELSPWSVFSEVPSSSSSSSSSSGKKGD